MKKVLISLCVIAAFGSCRSTKELLSTDSLHGAWNIIEINGSEVIPGAGKDFPYIEFNSQDGRISGNSGCNNMMGTFDTNAKPGVLNLSEIAVTRMMCPDMILEQNVLNALKNVKGYKRATASKIRLTNSLNRPVMVLEARKSISAFSLLEGEWKIKEVYGEKLPPENENEPFISFDTGKKRIHGNASCNMINGGIVTEDGKPHSISFPAVAVTMMACPEMETEGKILKALNEVKSFEILSGKDIALYDESGAVLLSLFRK